MRFKEVKKLINEQEDLFEVKMTSKNLAKLAKDIPGVKIGLEFEMIVPNTSVEDQDMEPDYDEDQRVRDIDDAVSFFDDGDYNTRHELSQLRGQMESDFFDWQIEQLDQAWHNNGFEFFQEYLDREDPFDPEDYEEAAYDYVLANNPTLHPDSDEFNEKKNERLQELNAEYYQEQWDDQGRNYDYAREEFDDEQRDNFTDSDWLDAEGIRYASDVESNYGYVTWPYYRSSDDDTDVKTVALDFMKSIGDKMIAVGDYHGYGGGYQKWTGSEWIKIGSAKPEDCFTVEPDGSLSGDSHRDTGLEFVSPPIPLDQIGETMKRVQQWAGNYGAYTGAGNATSMHTNISVPGYDLDKLDYLKAAILLGDEHVLREFDRINNSYTKPAIEKVKLLVQEKPDKAKELLDKMKSHLEATASKMIHSGVTDKYTSINTKDNRVEFRSPGGDYLSIIADDPQKMVDTINRMVVTLDAAMDPEKYKQEYQKKLYKVLTGQAGGREAKTGKKQEMKASDKDLLNIFARYAAGELPKQALKSFVRQAQLQRKVAKGEAGKMWWSVERAGSRIEVVAKNELDAKLAALKEWGRIASDSNLDMTTAVPLRTYEEETAAQEPEQQVDRTYRITSTGGALIAGDEYGSDQAALERAQYWAQRRGLDVVVRNPQGEEIGRVSASGEITPTAQQSQIPAWGVWDVQQGGFVNSRGGIGPGQGYLIGGDTEEAALAALNRMGLGSRHDRGELTVLRTPTQQFAQQPAAQQSAGQGNWGFWITSLNRFARAPGQADNNVLRRFNSREEAEQFQATHPNIRSDIEIREIEPATSQQPAGEQSSYELYRISDGRTVTAPAGNPIQFLATSPEDAESKIARYAADFNLGAPELFAVRSVLNVPANTQPTPQSQDNWSADFERRMQGGGNNPEWENPQPATTFGGEFTGEWKVVDPNGNEIYRFSGVGNSQADANVVAIRWLRDHPQHMQGGVEVLPVMG